MNIKEAMQTAITYEKRVRDAYKAAGEQADDLEVRRLLHSLAKDEHEHLRYLRDSYKLWRDTGQVQFGVLNSAIDWIALKGSLSAVLGNLRQTTAAKREPQAEAVERALSAEQETFAFYQRTAAGLPLDMRKVFERFVRVEANHLATVSAIYDALRGKSEEKK